MKVFLKNIIIKKILIVFITIIMTSNFIMPNYAFAANDESGGVLFTPISSLILGIADRVLATVQEIFVGEGYTIGSVSDITVNNGESKTELYSIKYSPGIIFSGKVPALDINFFSPMEGEETKIPVYETKEEKVLDNVKLEDLVEKGYISTAEIELRRNNTNFWSTATEANTTFTTWEHNGDIYIWEKLDYDQTGAAMSQGVIGTGLGAAVFAICSFIPGVNVGVWAAAGIGALVGLGVGVVTGLGTTTIEDCFTSAGTLYRYKYIASDSYEKTSTAAELRTVIAKWYNALRIFVIVSLLSVLVYIGIRIILSSNSAQNQAKYKNMLKDWFLALCIVFLLHYIMAFIVNVTERLIGIFNIDSVTPGFEDRFMTNIRNQITGDNGYWLYFGYVVMYLALIIMTITFTIQYLKRVVYIAFLTIIAPLIALTYPIDKVKDGQAQAFSMWIREYVFNCLLQPVHLMLYEIFIDSSSNFVNENPIYAIVALGFMMPAEKFFRKMFGFDKAQGMSALGAAAGGAMVMNMLNKIPKNGSKGKDGDAGSGAASNSKNVRTATRNGAPANITNNSNNSNNSNLNNNNNNISSNSTTQTPSSANGFRALGNRALSGTPNALKSAGRWTARNSIKAAGAIAGATVGLAAAVADGDFENPLGKVAIGAGVGAAGASALSSSVISKGKKITGSISETYQRGKYGDEAYNNMQFDKKFYASDDYKYILQDHPGVDSDVIRARTQEFLDNGITDGAQIREALQNNVSGDQYKEFSKAGVKSIKDMAVLQSQGITGAEFKMFENAGMNDANKVAQIVSGGKFKDSSGRTLGAAEIARRASIANSCKAQGITSKNQFIAYARQYGGIKNPKDAEELYNQMSEFWS